MSALPGTSLLRPADWAPAQLAGVRAHPRQRGPPSSQRPAFSGPPRSSPRRREASAARPQMSLPLRLPYCYPERRWRGALWLAYICARVTTPRPRRPRLLVAAAAGAPRRRRGGLLGGGVLCSGRKLQEARLERRQGRHPPRPGLVLRPPRSPGGTTARLRPSPAGARGGPSALRVIPSRLGSRPWGVQDSRQPCAPGTAPASGKEPELGANHRRSVEEAVPPLGALKAFADRGVARPGARWAGAWTAVLSRFWKISGKLRESCLAVGTGVEMPSICIKEPLESRAVSLSPSPSSEGQGPKSEMVQWSKIL